MGKESLSSFKRGSLEFFAPGDPNNERGTARLALDPRKFSPPGIRLIAERQIRSDTPKTIYLMTETRGLIKIDRQEFTNAQGSSKPSIELFIDISATLIANSMRFCLEEGKP